MLILQNLGPLLRYYSMCQPIKASAVAIFCQPDCQQGGNFSCWPRVSLKRIAAITKAHPLLIYFTAYILFKLSYNLFIFHVVLLLFEHLLFFFMVSLFPLILNAFIRSGLLLLVAMLNGTNLLTFSTNRGTLLIISFHIVMKCLFI